jgi:hypothetical protein
MVMFTTSKSEKVCTASSLPQASRIANNRLTECLAPYGHAPVPITPGHWKHDASDLIFTLLVDDFGIKFTKNADAEQLMTTLKKNIP